MKKFLVVLLSLGLIVAFGAAASAQTVKFSGSYIVEGAYESNMNQSGSDNFGAFGGNYSGAAIWQRLRIQPVFQIAEGLTLTTRFDALEKQWGNTVWRKATATEDYTNSRRQSTGAAIGAGPKAQENFEFERAFVTFNTAVGKFDVGYMSVGRFGTGFGDWENTGARAMFTTKLGPVALLAIWDKVYEADGARTAAKNSVDSDIDAYNLAAVYSAKGMEAGLLYKYTNGAATRAANYKVTTQVLVPYIKATFGPVYVEGELTYAFGKSKEYESGAGTDSKNDQFGGYLMAKTNLGPAYVGALAVYIQGDDLTDATKIKGGILNAKSVNPALIMLGDDYLTDIFPGGNAYDSDFFSSKKNRKAGLVMYNVFGGFKPTPKLEVAASLTVASFDKKPRVGDALTGAEYLSKKIGTELDVTATYKLYDNLSYMIGAGYLWSGDAFKAGGTALAGGAASVGNDYMLMNRLALSF